MSRNSSMQSVGPGTIRIGHSHSISGQRAKRPAQVSTILNPAAKITPKTPPQNWMQHTRPKQELETQIKTVDHRKGFPSFHLPKIGAKILEETPKNSNPLPVGGTLG